MMSLRSFRARRVGSFIRPRVGSFIRPVVEQLETRNLLSAATLGVAAAIAKSDADLQLLATNDYTTFLHRAPDAAGLSSWVSALKNGLSPALMDAAFAASPEYLAMHGGAGDAWISALYSDFLNRPADTAGLTFWHNALTAGVSPAAIARTFATSPERYADIITSEYQQLFGRAPDSTGLAFWENQMLHGLTLTGLLTDLVGSTEFYAHAGGTDQDFINAANTAILGGPPTAQQLGAFLAQMGNPVAPATTAATPLLTLDLQPLDINLLGLEVKTDEIIVTVSAEPGDGELLGNLLTTVSNLVNLQGVNHALNTVLDSVVGLLNSTSLNVSGVGSGTFDNATVADTPVLDAFVAPVHLNLLGALVDTSPIHLTITAHSGPGLVLGNVVYDIANLFNPPLPSQLDINTINQALENLLSELNVQIPNINGSATSTPPPPAGTERILSLTLAPIDLNLLGLILKTSQIQVNADAVTGNGNLLGNVLTTLLNTLGATPDNLNQLSADINALLAKVIGVLNASSLVLSPTALGSLTQVLQTLALPNLINSTGTATAPILNLIVASTDGTSPPVDVNLLGLVVTTSDIQAQLLAQTGDGAVLGNLLYNVANLLNPGGALSLLTILNALAV